MTDTTAPKVLMMNAVGAMMIAVDQIKATQDAMLVASGGEHGRDFTTAEQLLFDGLVIERTRLYNLWAKSAIAATTESTERLPLHYRQYTPSE